MPLLVSMLRWTHLRWRSQIPPQQWLEFSFIYFSPWTLWSHKQFKTKEWKNDIQLAVKYNNNIKLFDKGDGCLQLTGPQHTTSKMCLSNYFQTIFKLIKFTTRLQFIFSTVKIKLIHCFNFNTVTFEITLPLFCYTCRFIFLWNHDCFFSHLKQLLDSFSHVFSAY